jgi:hypothetical protein
MSTHQPPTKNQRIEDEPKELNEGAPSYFIKPTTTTSYLRPNHDKHPFTLSRTGSVADRSIRLLVPSTIAEEFGGWIGGFIDG